MKTGETISTFLKVVESSSGLFSLGVVFFVSSRKLEEKQAKLERQLEVERKKLEEEQRKLDDEREALEVERSRVAQEANSSQEIISTSISMLNHKHYLEFC